MLKYPNIITQIGTDISPDSSEAYQQTDISPNSSECKKPEGMTKEEWSYIFDMSPDLRKTSISLWKQMVVHRDEALLPSQDVVKHSVSQEKSKSLIPLCPDLHRASPNIFLRSAIFSAIQGKTRRSMKNELVAAQGGYEIRMTTVETLDQSDFDVWLQSAQMARCSPLGTVCIFTGYAFLKKLERGTGASGYEWLKNSLRRLQNTTIEIKTGGKWGRINLLNQAFGDDSTKLIKLQFDPFIIRLFGFDSWTALRWEERRQLRGKPLALWLHGYFASHAVPYPIKAETLWKMCGSDTERLRRFKEALKKAFAELEKVAGIKATLVSDGDLVVTKKNPSPAQERHLLNKIAQKNGKAKQTANIVIRGA
jgi:hypothetical protein